MNLPRHVEQLECSVCGMLLRRDGIKTPLGRDIVYTHDDYSYCENSGKRYMLVRPPVVEVEEIK